MLEATNQVTKELETTMTELDSTLYTIEARRMPQYDPRRYVLEYPWRSFGVAVAVGYALGRLSDDD